MKINITMDNRDRSVLELVKNLLLNAAGSSLLAFGVCAFIIPFDLIVGGATGISLVAHKLTGINVSIIAYIINISVLVPGYLLGSRKLVLGSVFSSLVYPTALAVFEQIPAITTLADNTIMACLCGGVVCGTGVALVMRSGGSTGGLDIPELLLHKYFKWPVNTIMRTVDIIIMCLQIPFSVVTNVIYGIFFTYIMTNSLNKVLTLGADRLKVTVVSERWEEICYELTHNDFGVTLVHADGGYTKTPIKRVESIMTAERYRMAMRIIDNVDPTAFTTIEKVTDVRGQGYTREREPVEME